MREVSHKQGSWWHQAALGKCTFQRKGLSPRHCPARLNQTRDAQGNVRLGRSKGGRSLAPADMPVPHSNNIKVHSPKLHQTEKSTWSL